MAETNHWPKALSLHDRIAVTVAVKDLLNDRYVQAADAVGVAERHLPQYAPDVHRETALAALAILGEESGGGLWRRRGYQVTRRDR